MPERYTVKHAQLRRPRSTYPFEDMTQVGDYFDAPDDMGDVLNQEGKSARRHSILSSARNYARRHNPDFKAATTIYYNGKTPMVRCQRVDSGEVGERLEKPFKVVRESK
jgi:hypothetical protein